MMRGMLTAVMMVLLAGCSTPAANGDAAGNPGGVELAVDHASYRAGGAIVVTLRNRSAQSIGYNLCGAALEVRTSGTWREATERLTEVCTMELRTLARDASDTYRHTLPANLAAGEYRIRTNVESPLGGNFTSVASGAFQVTR